MVGIDPARVSAWIAGLGLGVGQDLHFQRLGQGQSNLTYLLTDGYGRNWVLRRPPVGVPLAAAHDIAREHDVLLALGSTALPVPTVFGLCLDQEVADAPLLLMEHVEGVVVERGDAAGAIPDAVRAAVAISLPATLARIHEVDPGAVGLASLSTSSTPYAVRQIRRWRGQWERSRMRELPLIDELADRLAASVPEQRETTLVHGDFHLSNVILSPSDGAVRAVIDWELCTLGDPLADLGGLLAYWSAADELRDLLPPFSGLPGVPGEEELAATYATASGRSLEALGFWKALGLWKVAIIAAGVIRRSSQGPTDADIIGSTPTLVEKLARRADAVAAGAGI